MEKLFKRENQSGFTIVEAVIVMALAAAIVLVVFMAVPAAQRNSRNNAIRSEASAVLAGIYQYISDNDGSLPTNISNTAPDITITGSGSTPTSIKIQPDRQVYGVSPGGCGATSLNDRTIFAYRDCKCNETKTTNVYSPKSFSVLFSIDTSSSVNTVQCIER